MIAKANSMSYGMAKAEYDENKVIDGVKVASEATRQNVYGCDSHEIVEEMTDTQHIRSPVRNPFLDIVVTLSAEDCVKITAPNQSKWLIDMFMHDFMVEQVGLTEEEYSQMQWIAYEHAHTNNSDSLKHWHILANRVLLNGKLVSDSWIGKKAARTANKISREYGMTDAVEVSKENKRDVYKAACFVLGNMREFYFDKYLHGMNILGYSTRMAMNSKGEVQGYYITAQSGREYKASAVNRNLTIGRLEAFHEYLHNDMKVRSRKYPGSHVRMKPPHVPKVNIARLLEVFDVGTGICYATKAPYGSRRKGKRWEDMSEEERRAASTGMSI